MLAGENPAARSSLWTHPEHGADPLTGLLDGWLAEHDSELVGVRRQIHAHPELSGYEFETAALVMRELTRAGLSPRLLPKKNGVICDVGTGDRAVAFRADLDALPIMDTKDVPYRSTVPGSCHACGHDVHTAILLGLGQFLAVLNQQGKLPGRVRLIFQPSEEKLPSGAPEIIALGELKDVDAIFALHCAPQLLSGLVGVRSGPITAAVDMLEVRLTGRGGHTARPHLTADVVNALGRVVVDLPALLDRRVDPRDGVSVVFGAVRSGDAPNAIPMEGLARGTVRTANREVWLQLPELIPALVHDVVAGTKVDAEVSYLRGMPPVINDRGVTSIIANAAGAALGPDRVVEAEMSMGAEDFAFFAEQVPASMIRLGVSTPGMAERHDIHQPTFDVDEKCIDHGVRVFAHTALAALPTVTY